MKTKRDKQYEQWIGGTLLGSFCLPMLVQSEYILATSCVLAILLAPAVAAMTMTMFLIGATLLPTHGKLMLNLAELSGQFAVCIDRVLALIPSNPFAFGLPQHLFQLGIVLASKNEQKGGLEAMKEVVELLEKTEGADAPALVEPLCIVSSCNRALGNFEESVKCANRLLAIARIHPAECSTIEGATLSDLCITYAKLGRVKESIDTGERAVRLIQALPDTLQTPEHASLIAIALNNLGWVYSYACRHDRACTLYERALEMKLKAMPENSPSIGASYGNMACAMNAKEKFAEAKGYACKAMTIYDISGNKQSYADVLQALGNAERGLGEYDNSEKHLKEALALQEKFSSATDPDLAEYFRDLARLYREKKQGEISEKWFNKSLTLFRSTLGDNHPQVAQTLSDYAKLLRLLDRSNDAEVAEQKSQSITDSNAKSE